MLYAKIERETITVLVYEQKNDPQLVDDPRKPKWVPVVEESQPAYDRTTHRLRSDEVVTLDTVTRGWAIEPLPSGPTVDEIYDQTIKNERVLKAAVLALNDGTFVPGAALTGTKLKQIIRAKM